MLCRHFFHKYCILKWFKSTSSSQYDPYDNFEYDDFECDDFGNSAINISIVSLDAEDFNDDHTDDRSSEYLEYEDNEDFLLTTRFQCPFCRYICC